MKKKLLVFVCLAAGVGVVQAGPVLKEIINIEAESALLMTPMETGWDIEASGDLSIHSEETGKGEAHLFFSTHVDTGTYSVWARVQAPDSNSNTFLVTVGNLINAPVTITSLRASYQWVRIADGLVFYKGVHTLGINAGNAIRLDKFIVTNNPSVTAISLAGNPVFHICPKPLPEVSDKCLENIVEFKIKPISEANISSMTKCQRINDAMLEMEQLLGYNNMAYTRKVWAECSSCTVMNVFSGCPWDVIASTR